MILDVLVIRFFSFFLSFYERQKQDLRDRAGGGSEGAGPKSFLTQGLCKLALRLMHVRLSGLWSRLA